MHDFEIDMTNIKNEDVQKYEPIPAGDYELKAEEWELKYSKNNTKYITVKYRVVGPLYENWVIWENFAIGAKNSDFAIMRVKMWALATGKDIKILTPKAMNQLIDEPFTAKVGIERSREYNDKNKIRNFIIPPKNPEIIEDKDMDFASDNLDEDVAPF